MSFPRACGLDMSTFFYDRWRHPDETIKAGIQIYAVSMVTAALRRYAASQRAEILTQMLRQASREAVKGHERAMRIFDDPR